MRTSTHCANRADLDQRGRAGPRSRSTRAEQTAGSISILPPSDAGQTLRLIGGSWRRVWHCPAGWCRVLSQSALRPDATTCLMQRLCHGNTIARLTCAHTSNDPLSPVRVCSLCWIDPSRLGGPRECSRGNPSRSPARLSIRVTGDWLTDRFSTIQRWAANSRDLTTEHRGPGPISGYAGCRTCTSRSLAIRSS